MKRLQYGNSDFEETLRQWMNKVESGIDDWKRDIAQSDKNLGVTNAHNSDSEIEIWMMITFEYI